MNIKKLENICAAILVIAFFLPWFSLGGLFSISGFNAAGIGGAAILLWLIPLLSIGVLVSEFMDLDKKISTYIAYASGAVPLIYVLQSLFSSVGDFFSTATFGIYLTLVASIGMLLAAFGVIKIPE